jgi:hypothetical protein
MRPTCTSLYGPAIASPVALVDLLFWGIANCMDVSLFLYDPRNGPPVSILMAIVLLRKTTHGWNNQ